MKKIFTANQDTLTLHIRITKKCNADCSYCSSFERDAKDLMSLNDLEKSLSFIVNKINELSLGGKRNNISVQYIGGELLTVPSDYLENFTKLVEAKLSPLFLNFRHGSQSNLIGSENKINRLFSMFDGNVGTSFDHFTEQRTINSNAKKYKTIFIKNASFVKKNYGKNISGVIVIDEKMAPNIHKEIEFANKNRRHITLRPVFNGGSPVNKITISDLEKIYEDAFEAWFLKQNIIIEPFYSYLQRRIYSKENLNLSTISGCPSQHNCANVSLNLEPDGSLYICQDMADSKEYVLGNSLKNEFNYDLFYAIQDRTNHLNSDCLSCSYFNECQGGCMKEAIEHTEDGIYGKTIYCSIWKKIFANIDKKIATYSIQDINKWLEKISKY